MKTSAPAKMILFAAVSYFAYCGKGVGNYLGQSVVFLNPACTGSTEASSAIRRGRITTKLASDGVVHRSTSSEGAQFVLGKEGCRYSIAIGKPIFVRGGGSPATGYEDAPNGELTALAIWPETDACRDLQVDLVLAESKVLVSISWPAEVGDRQFEGAALTADLIQFAAGTGQCVVQYRAVKIQ